MISGLVLYSVVQMRSLVLGLLLLCLPDSAGLATALTLPLPLC